MRRRRPSTAQAPCSRRDDTAAERPLNVYGYSKLLFDSYVRRRHADQRGRRSKRRAPVVGLRYFNVYGPGEAHKGPMASVAFHLHGQVAATGEARLFEGSGGYAAGEQRRDFVHVADVADVNLWFYERQKVSGVFNVGTGASATFNEVAKAIIAWHGKGAIRYIPFPSELESRYQSFTEADITALAPRRLRAAVSRRPLRDQGLPRRARRSAVTAADKVLIVGPSWVGDMVMAQALYKLLRQQNPNVEIHVVAPPWSLPVLERMPEVARGIELAVGHGEVGLRRRWKLARRLRAERYTRAIVLPRSAKAALVPWLAGVPLRTGFRGEWRYGLLNDVRSLDVASIRP